MRISINAKHLAALNAIAPKNDVRGCLNGVRFDFEAGRAIAIDGHRLLSAPIIVSLDGGETLPESVTLARAKAPRSRTGEILIGIDSDPATYFGPTGEVVYVPRLEDQKFPDWRQVVKPMPAPEDVKLSGPLGLNPRLIADVQTALGSEGVGLHPTSPNEQVHVTFMGEPDLVFIIIPMRL